jgi:amino acid adenylation domain-containing protein
LTDKTMPAITNTPLMPSTLPYGLHAGFLRSVQAHPERPALDVSGHVYRYAELYQHAAVLASTLQTGLAATAPARVGVLASRSLQVYSGLLGTLMAGCAVVPLNPGFPADRTRQMADLAGLGAVVVDAAGEAQLAAVLDGAQAPVLVCLPGEAVNPAHGTRWPQHRFVALGTAPVAADFAPVSVSPDALAYLFFTSGSTGAPKGVGVLHRNVVRFVEMSMERYRQIGISEWDRFSQFYDITFDSSMFDLYVSWAFGACLCSPSTIDWVNPNKYIETKGLTVIDIVPSTGHAMNRSNGWRPGRFTQLRLCRFGGEALSADLAAALAAAAPGAVVDNVYGPTECTVDAAYYRWQGAASAAEAEHGVVPIGVAGPQVGLRVVDAQMREVPVGGEGELLISGPQVTPGYWQSPERTAASFIQLPGSDQVHYRTGDLVRRPAAGGPIPYLGRLDFQIKISGVRIELGEVEQALRAAAGTDLAVAVGWPQTTSGASGIVAFIVKPGADAAAIRNQLKATLPSVMVPKDIHVIDDMPLNVNGKIDRKALIARLAAAA